MSHFKTRHCSQESYFCVPQVPSTWKPWVLWFLRFEGPLPYIKLDFYWHHEGTWGMQNTFSRHHWSPTALNVEDEQLTASTCYGLDQQFPTRAARQSYLGKAGSSQYSVKNYWIRIWEWCGWFLKLLHTPACGTHCPRMTNCWSLICFWDPTQFTPRINLNYKNVMQNPWPNSLSGV